jgi:UDP-N-acetylglucosamine 4,6-dehydratase
MFNNKNIIITGGTGSFGKEFVIYLLKNYKPKKVVVFSRDELKQFDFSNFIKNKGYDLKKIRFFIGDVRDRSRLSLAFQNMDFVVHAAALKQIVAAEYNPQEVIRTNIQGAENVIFSALEQNVKKVIALSTDKAVNPVNLYGATKLVSDKLFINANNLAGQKKTRFAVVRYGNVINSRGSVIPFFKKMILEKNFFPVTHKDMTRFFIKVEDGVKFVIKSFERMFGGEIFIPKVDSIKIIDIARTINPRAKIKIIGIRPGEKMHEILCPHDEAHLTLEFKDHLVIKPSIGLDIKSNYKINAIKEKGKKVSNSFEYVSNKNKFLSLNNIKKIIS